MDKLIDEMYRILVINKESLYDTNILFYDCDNYEEIIQEFYSKYGLKIYLRGAWRYSNEETDGEGYYVYASLEDWNTFMPYTYFQTDIELLQSKNYNPIAVCQLFFEDTFVFVTPEESQAAFEEFERNTNRENRIVGWWYGLEEFKKTVKTYELEGNRVLIHWIKPTE